MLPAALYALLAAAAAVGIGSAAAASLRINPNTGERGLLGLLTIGVLSALIHFFLPLSAAVHYAILAAGFVCAALYWRAVPRDSVALAALAFAAILLQPPPRPYHDNGLYHIPTYLWNTTSPLVVGLANLHDRLGFNSLLFLIAPVVAPVTLGWVADALVAAFVLLAALERLPRHAPKASAIGFWFLASLLILGVFFTGLTQWVGVFNADGLAGALIVYWSFLLLEYEHKIRPETVPALLILIAAFAVMVKLVAAPLLLATLLFLGIPAIRRRGRPLFQNPRAVIAALAALLLWSLRGLALSGCALYPLPSSCIAQLPWSVAHSSALGEYSGIRSWARWPGRNDYSAVLATWDWFRPWLDATWDKPPFPQLRWLLLAALAGIALSLLRRKRIDRAAVPLAAVLALGIAYWFWGAPDPRFGIGYFAALEMLCAAIAAAAILPGPNHRTNLSYAVLAVVAIAPVYAFFSGVWRTEPQPYPQPAVMTLDGAWGLPVHVSERTGNMCWNTPQPCTPWYDFSPEALGRIRWRNLAVHGASRPLASAPDPAPLPLLINSGGGRYTDSQGRVWLPDAGAAQGWPISTTIPITGTADPGLYGDARYAHSGRLEYQFHIPDGRYQVTLKFAEIYFDAPRKRVFDIRINGELVQPGFDIFSAAGSANQAIDLHLPATVTTGRLTISLTSKIDDPMLNAIELVKNTR